jgi:Zn-dependent oligopeptidase
MGSENRADQAWDFLSSWFVIWARFYRAGDGFPPRLIAFVLAARAFCKPNAKARLLTFAAIDFATLLVALKKRVFFCPLFLLLLFP